MSDEEEAAPGVPEWVVTYGDMMSLLLTFFIMLVSMSTLKEDEKEVRAMLDAISERFGSSNGLFGIPGLSFQSTSANDSLSSRGSRVEGGSQRGSRNSEGPAGAHHTVERINHGAVATLGGPARFGRFDATLTADSKADLDVIAGILSKKPNRIMVRGHATREPLPRGDPLVFDGFEVRDRWDLSYARARAVAEYLIEHGIDRRRLLVSAAGDTEPRTPTRRDDERQVNRRVDVFILDSYISALEAADSEPKRSDGDGSESS